MGNGREFGGGVRPLDLFHLHLTIRALAGQDVVVEPFVAFILEVDITIQTGSSGNGFPKGEVFTVTATGDQGNRGASAFMLVDKVDG